MSEMSNEDINRLPAQPLLDIPDANATGPPHGWDDAEMSRKIEIAEGLPQTVEELRAQVKERAERRRPK